MLKIVKTTFFVNYLTLIQLMKIFTASKNTSVYNPPANGKRDAMF